MKKPIAQIISMPLAVIVSIVVFFCFSLYTDNVFHRQLNEWIELYRGHLKEDGVNPLQISTMLSLAQSSAETTYRSLSNLYSTFLFPLIGLVVALFWRITNLEKQLKEIKEKLNV